MNSADSHARQPFWVVGHRGSPAIEVENTIPSLDRALGDGANALEIDLCVTSDGEVVLWHDFSPDELRARLRRLGLEPLVRYRPQLSNDPKYHRPTSELTLAEFRAHCGYATGWRGKRVSAHIPTLTEFMEWATRKKTLGLVFFDVKVPGEFEHLIRVLVDRVQALVARFEPKFRIIFESASLSATRALIRHAPDYRHALDVEPPAGIVFKHGDHSAARIAIANRLRLGTAQRPRGITVFPFRTHCRIVRSDVALMRRHNSASPAVPLEGLCSFTINREPEMRTLIELGVCGIQSDRPELLRRVAERCGCHLAP